MNDLTDRPAPNRIIIIISSEADCLHIFVDICEGVSLGESGGGMSEKLTSQRHGDNNQRVLFGDVMFN